MTTNENEAGPFAVVRRALNANSNYRASLVKKLLPDGSCYEDEEERAKSLLSRIFSEADLGKVSLLQRAGFIVYSIDFMALEFHYEASESEDYFRVIFLGIGADTRARSLISLGDALDECMNLCLIQMSEEHYG